jgi:Trk K+ transport system NAD-binding subunit/voltage-gated potassium channel Kch
VTTAPAPNEACPTEGLIVVCGLGSLGQTCLLRLLPFAVPLRGIDCRPPAWRHTRLEERLAPDLVLGDMRLPNVLRLAGAEGARAVLLLSSESTVNFEAALQVRLLNPSAEIVVRSSGRLASLGALLEQRLPGVAVVDPLLLTAGAITEALRPGDQVATFAVDGQSYRVLEGLVEDRRLQRALRLNGSREGQQPGLLITPMGAHRQRDADVTAAPRPGGAMVLWRRLLAVPLRWLGQRTPLQRGFMLVLLALLGGGMALFSRAGGWKQGMFVTLALLKGEYVDPVNVVLDPEGGIRAAGPWLIGGSLFYSLMGTLLTSLLVAVILEWLLRERFGPPRPGRLRRGSRRILLIEGGELAVKVAGALHLERHAVVRVDSRPDPPREAPGVVVFDRAEPALEALEPCRVEAVGLLSPDLLANLQGALDLQRRWPLARVGILAHALEAVDQLGRLLGGVSVISITDLAADAVVATAFGERVEEIRSIQGVNLLLVRIRIEAGDTLRGLSISRVENGYGVTAVQLSRPGRATPLVLPSPDLLLADGDQLLVLATLAELRRIEAGRLTPPAWRVRLRGALPEERQFDALQALARHLGAAPGALAGLLDGEEHLTPALDEDLGELLVRELRRQGVRCELEPVGEGG